MSALGHKRTCRDAKRHVRFTPESGHVRCTSDVRFVPIADICTSRLFRISYSNPAETPDLLQSGLTHSIEEFD